MLNGERPPAPLSFSADLKAETSVSPSERGNASHVIYPYAPHLLVLVANGKMLIINKSKFKISMSLSKISKVWFHLVFLDSNFFFFFLYIAYLFLTYLLELVACFISYLLLAALGRLCCVQAFSSFRRRATLQWCLGFPCCRAQALAAQASELTARRLAAATCGLQGMQASGVAAQELISCGQWALKHAVFSNCGTGLSNCGFLSTAPPGKSPPSLFKSNLLFVLF